MTQAELLKEEYNQEDKFDELYSNSDHEYDAWFRAEVAKGLKDIDEGNVLSNKEVTKLSIERNIALNLPRVNNNENYLD